MTYVGITRSLREDIREEILRRKNMELSALPTDRGVLINKLKDNPFLQKKVIDYINGPYLWAYPSIESFDRVQAPVVTIVKNNGTPQKRTICFNVGPIPICILACVNKQSSYINTVAPVLLFEGLTHIPELVTLFERSEEFDEVDTRWSKIASQVDNYLTRCKSLNEAVKLWPDVVQYVPKHYLDRLEEKRGSVKKGPSEEAIKALEAIEKDKVAQSNMLARFAQADQNNGS